MSRWTKSARAIQRAVPIGLVTGGTNGNSRPNKVTTPPTAFSEFEITSLQEDIRTSSTTLTEEKRQLLEGLFDLAQDPILQNQVLTNPAFGRILSAATKIPLANSSVETTLVTSSGGFPEIQGLVLDNSASGGWSVVVRTSASTPSLSPSPSSPSTSQRISLSEPYTQTNSMTTEPIHQPDMVLTTTEGSFSNETLFNRIWAYVSSLWSWLIPSSSTSAQSSSFSSPFSTPSSFPSSTNTTGWFGNPQCIEDKVERMKMWSILGATMIMLALVLRRVYLHFNVAEQHSRELGRLLIMATLDHVFAFDFKHV